jgi:lantibiotic biosynthesis protein
MTPDPAGESSWQPLVTGPLAAAALAAVEAIAADLRAAPAPADGPGAEEAALWQASLASGDAGRALFFAYLDFHREAAGSADAGPAQDDSAAQALDLLDRAVDALAVAPPRAGLFAGLPGIGWAAEHLRGRLFAQDADAGDALDEAVLDWLSRFRWEGGHDLLGGLAGLGVYALERLPQPAARRAVEAVVERLAGSAERGPAGAAWLTPPERLPPARRRDRPQGCYDLGAAHGAAGVIAFLGGACRAGVGAARPLLDEAVRRLLACRLPDRGEGRFPSFLAPGVEARGSRLAWCYGDLGIAAALAVAGEGAGRPDWRSLAFEIAGGAAGRTLDSSRVVDAGLCHGAAGVAHLFNRLHQASGEASLGEAARRWLARALALRAPGSGAGGFRTWETDTAGGGAWYDDPGFLTGAAGTGLALLAALSPVEPAWDRALLVSLRPEPAGRSSFVRGLE